MGSSPAGRAKFFKQLSDDPRKVFALSIKTMPGMFLIRQRLLVDRYGFLNAAFPGKPMGLPQSPLDR
ncbi:hypothetical protein BN874_2590008 [Candidatus Contendobacter odensis Run_B_J11]|uniref:Uncharacterized protein n=1 Tax=Candidatus Contendobacter odensis Run_B_J11 TaxID=1400861 RepID=A0A7U7GCJ1_9GAMM|nr:hypothetical protein BN874_2590008 [Candidatus Contendobacter odensis Run_B_J11]